MLKILVKKQLGDIFRSYTYDAKKNRARSKEATIGFTVLFVVLMVGVLGGLFTLLSLAMCESMAQVGMSWLYFTIMTLLAAFLGIFGSVFNTYSTLYMAKDNDLLLSLPIPVRTIMAARLVSVYLMGLMYSAVVLLPAIIVYWVVVGITVPVVVGCMIQLLLLSVFVLTLSCALGWVVAKISQKLKNKSFITVLVSLVFIGAYYFFYAKAQSLLTELLANAAYYGAQIRGKAYPLYLIGRAGAGDGPAMAVVTAVVLVLFVLLFWLLSRSFLRIATASGSTVRRVYREKTAVQRGAGMALLARELRHFGGNPSYMLNCGLGIVMLPAAGIALLIKGRALAQLLDDAFGAGADIVPVLLCAAVCLLASMNDMAAPSVSLEGRQLWLAQSLPVTPWQVLHAKLDTQLLLTGVPMLFCALCAVITLPGGAAEMALAVVVALLYTLLSALAALALGLRLPNLTWTNETTPIKQSGCVMLALFANWFYAIALGGLYFLCGRYLSAAAYLALAAAITAVVCALLLRWVKQRGTRIFAAL